MANGGWFDNLRRLFGWKSSAPAAQTIGTSVIHVAEFAVPTVAQFRDLPTIADCSAPSVALFRPVGTVADFTVNTQ